MQIGKLFPGCRTGNGRERLVWGLPAGPALNSQLWMKVVICSISKQTMQPPSRTATSILPLGPWGNSARSQMAATEVTTLWALRGFRTDPNRTLGLVSEGAYQRGDFSYLRFLRFSIQGKVPNLLTWDVWFSLANSNLLMFWLSGFCFKPPPPRPYILAPPLGFQSSPSEHPRNGILSLSPQVYAPKKT